MSNSKSSHLKLSGLSEQNALEYLGDLFIFGRIIKEQSREVESYTVSAEGRWNKIQESESRFFYRKNYFLEHFVSANGAEIDLQKLNAVRHMSKPSKIKQLRAALENIR